MLDKFENDSELEKKSSEIKEVFYDTLFSTFPDILLMLDTKGKIINISDSTLKLLGTHIKKEDIIGKSGFEYVAPEHLEMVRKDYETALNEGTLRGATYKFKRDDATFLYGKLSATLIKDEQGKPKFLVVVIKDITEENTAKAELIESKQMFQLVLDNIPQFIFWKDINSVYLGCNRNFARVAGVGDPNNIIGKTDYDLAWEKSQAESFFEIDRLVMESNKPEYHIIEPQLQADGKEAWVDTNKIPLHNSQGDVVGILGTYEDITERVLAKKALEDSEKKYRHLFDNSPLAIYLLDFEGNIVDLNETARIRFHSQVKEQILGDNIFDWIGQYNKNKLPFFRNILQALINGETIDSFEFTLFRKEGTIVWINAYLSLFTIEDKTLIQIMLQEITDRKFAEQKLKESEKNYRESYNRANLFKDIFSHDIGNILQNLGSANELIDMFLEEPDKKEELKEITTIFKEQILRGAKLVDNIQKLSQIEESKNPLKKVELCEVLKNSINFIHSRIQKVHLNIHVDTFSQNINVLANELLVDVFENLLINAVKYNDNPTIEIHITISKEKLGNCNYIRIEFADNGIGIQDARKEEIFLRAYNKDKSISGLGLGLSLVKKIIETYEGKIWVEDRIEGDYSKGSNFVILLTEAD